MQEEGVATVSTWLGSGVPAQASRCQSKAPLARSKQRTNRFLPLSRATVRKMRSPQTTGDDWPLCNQFVRQRNYCRISCQIITGKGLKGNYSKI